MEITYTDIDGNLLTEQQIQLAGSYIKVYRENNRLRREEFYYDNEYSSTLHYVEIGESHSDLLASKVGLINIVEIEDIDEYYTKYYGFSYFNGVLKSKGLEVRKHETINLMGQELDLKTNLPIYNKTYKYYVNQNSGFDFVFKYYPTGELAFVIVSNEALSFYEQYKSSELNLIPKFEWWDQYSSYYLNAEPAVPDGIVIV